MKKIAEFLVQRRYIVFVLMAVITVVCAIMTSKVNVITDMTTFLPDSSSMKKGVDIMSEEFSSLPAGGSIRLMGTDMSEEDKKALTAELEALPNVSSVDYDFDSGDYNKGSYSLFIVNSDYSFSDDEMMSLEKAISDEICPKYSLVYDTNNSDLGSGIPFYIIIIALAILLAVLFTMCESWFEPLIFLVTIGMAVIINTGTNVFLDGISNITNSIASILQLVLSMDYSIILINRYRQEQATETDNAAAMTKAVGSAAASIMSSSLTTVVGLLSLIFMSFKIGADMGIVLAKGVFISMVCIFTVLPALILSFNRAIEKTAKKVPHIKMDKIAGFYTKTRHVFPCLLVGLFVAAFVLKGSTQINYSMPKPSEVAEVFPKINSIVVLYNTADENSMAEIAGEIEKNNNVDSVSAYSTTLGRQYTADDMSAEITDMSDDMEIKPWMLDFIYYDYFDYDISSLSLNEFLTFVKEFADENPDLLKDFDSDTLDKLDMLAVFADRNELSKARTADEISVLLGMDKDQAAQLFGITGKETMSLSEFLQTVQNLSRAASAVTPELSQQLKMAAVFTDPGELSKERTAAELAQVFGIDETMLSQLMMMSGAEKMSIQSLMAMMSSNPQFSANLSPETAAKMSMITMLTDPDELAKQRTGEEISTMFGFDSNLLTAMGRDTMSISELMTMAENMGSLSDMDLSADNGNFALIQRIISDTESGKEYSPKDISELFGSMSEMMNENTVSLIYKIYFSKSAEITETMSLEQLFGSIISMSEDEKYEDLFDEDMKSSLLSAKGKLDDGKNQLVGANYSIMMIATKLPDESEETDKFIENLESTLNTALSGEYYLIGNSPMQHEMAGSFSDEFNKISLITAAAIFVVILITFRSLSIPAILILVIQTAVYAVMVIIGIAGSGIYYLALLIVQSILMGATVDYGILFTSYYREGRKTLAPPEALAAAYNGSMHTILTSGLIITLVTFILGFAFSDPAINQIVHIISLGAACAIVLIVFILPGVLISLDKITSGAKNEKL